MQSVYSFSDTHWWFFLSLHLISLFSFGTMQMRCFLYILSIRSLFSRLSCRPAGVLSSPSISLRKNNGIISLNVGLEKTVMTWYRNYVHCLIHRKMNFSERLLVAWNDGIRLNSAYLPTCQKTTYDRPVLTQFNLQRPWTTILFSTWKVSP